MVTHFAPRGHQTLSQWVERANADTDRDARQLYHQRPHLGLPRLAYHLTIAPVARFWTVYVTRPGRPDGMPGLAFAALSAWFYCLRWAKYWALTLPPSSDRWRQRDAADTEPRGCAQRAQEAAGGQPTALSVIILTKNEERRIRRCLQSVRWADEVVVVDGQSQDRTVEICRAFGATVISHAFDGSFATDRNLGLESASGTWALQIDADDVVTPEFAQAANAILQADPPYEAVTFRRRTVFLGRTMRYGGWYYTVPNLVRRQTVRYEGHVHERPRLRGAIGALSADIEHHPCDDLAEFLARHNRYTSLQAQELCERYGRLSLARLARLLWTKPLKTFWKSYVKKQGFREGWHGLIFAEFFAGVELLKWAKYWEAASGGQPMETNESVSCATASTA